MNGAILLAISALVLLVAYFVYGTYLEKIWGIDGSRKTPAHEHKDGVDYVPASKAVLFGHQFASIAGAGPINGPIIAAMFGWVPVLAWILVGGIFFGAVQDFSSMYASVRNQGKTISVLIEKYIGVSGKVFFLIFVWLFCILVIAAFADIVSGTFNGFVNEKANVSGASTASTSIIFMVFALLLGLYFRKMQPSTTMQCLIGMGTLVLALFLGLTFPIFASKQVWFIFTFGYIFVASVLPVWLLLQPRDFLNSFLLLAMLLAAFVGILVAQPAMNLPAFTAFTVKGQYLFPMLFVTIACGAISGFHALVSSGTSSKQVNSEKDMKLISFGGMLLECFLAVIALVAVGALATSTTMPQGTPPTIFANALASFLSQIGLPSDVIFTLITLAISAFALTSLDSVARVGRLSFQEIFHVDGKVPDSATLRFISSNYFATFITLFMGLLLALGGYQSIWPLFGSANQLLAALALIAVSVFLQRTGKKNFMLIIPMYSMLLITVTSLCILINGNITKILNNTGSFSANLLQLIFAILLLALGLIVAKQSLFPSKKTDLMAGRPA